MSVRSKAAAAACAAVVILASCEAVLRRRLGPDPARLDRLFHDQEMYLDEQSRGPFFRKSPAGVWITARPRAELQQFPDAKAPGELRVFVAGESVARRLGTRPLENALSRAFPRRRVRVIDCGMGSYDSARVAAVVRELHSYHPDLIVVLAGNNDGRTSGGGSGLLGRANLILRRYWTWRLAQDAVMRALAPSPAARRARVEKRFEAKLTELAAGTRAAHIPLVLCTLPVNARDFPPMGALPSIDRDFSWAWNALEGRRFAEAVQGLREFVGRDPEDAMGHYWLARALEGAKDRAGARAEFLRALALDFPDRCTPARNEAIRRVAKAQGASLADLERLFDRLSPRAPPGWDLFDDGVHFRPALYADVASAIAGAASGRGYPPAPRPDLAWRPGPETEGLALDALSQAVEAGLQDPPVLLERAVAQLAFALRVDPGAVRRATRRPEALQGMLSDNEWTSPIAQAVPAGWTSVLRHVDEAERRLKLGVK